MSEDADKKFRVGRGQVVTDLVGCYVTIRPWMEHQWFLTPEAVKRAQRVVSHDWDRERDFECMYAEVRAVHRVDSEIHVLVANPVTGQMIDLRASWTRLITLQETESFDKIHDKMRLRAAKS